MITVDLRNERGWDPGSLEVDVCRDTLRVRHCGRMVAELDRERFAEWLTDARVPYVADDTRWTLQAGVTSLSIGRARFVVRPEGLAALLAVI